MNNSRKSIGMTRLTRFRSWAAWKIQSLSQMIYDDPCRESSWWIFGPGNLTVGFTCSDFGGVVGGSESFVIHGTNKELSAYFKWAVGKPVEVCEPVGYWEFKGGKLVEM